MGRAKQGGPAPAQLIAPAPAVERGETRSTGALDLRGPARLLLGRDREAEVTLALPTDVAPDSVQLAVSTGAIELGKVGANGRLRARYVAPTARWPQLAIVTATATRRSRAGGRIVDWMAIALVGQPRIELNSEPRTRVEVQVAGASFGPVITNRNGLATIAVVAPPGVDSAMMIAHDEVGNVKQTSITLNTPPLRRTSLLCPAAIDADGRAALDVVVATANGLPDGRAPTLSTSVGQLEAARPLAPGWYHVALTASPSTAHLGAAVTVSASAIGDGAMGPGAPPEPPAERCVIAFPTTPPVAIAPPTPPAKLPTGAASELGTVRASQPRRTPVADVELRLGYLTNFGKVSAPVLFGEGQYRLPWLGGGIALGLRAGGWWSRTAVASQGGGSPRNLDVSGLPVLVHLHYRLPVPVVRIGLGAGGGVAWSWLRLDGEDGGGALTGRAVSGVASALLDLDVPLGRGALGVELGYLYAPVNQPSIQGNLAGLHVTAGYRLEL